MTNDWQVFSHPAFALRWRYPAVTPAGQAVEQIEEEREGVWRAHLRSRDGRELYFEVRRYPELTPQAAYERHRAELAQRFEGEGLALTPLEETELAGRPAWTYSFQWSENARVALLAPDGPALYRLIYDPRSELNRQVLGTVGFEGFEARGVGR
jgi:hypothetical protein